MPRIKLEKRGQQKRKIKPVILIITEGSKTEPMYFDNFRTRQTNIDVRIVGNKSDGAKTDYDHLLDKAVAYKKEEQISIEYGDSIQKTRSCYMPEKKLVLRILKS